MTDISLLRLANQQIIKSAFKTAKEMVAWMGAMQAQDFNMAKWAIGVRLPNSTEKVIDSAIDKGEIIRTHLLRPTWHFVSSDDIYWMLELAAPQIRAVMKSRDKTLELDQKLYMKSNFILENALQGGEHLSREELVTELELANIKTDSNRSSHFLMRAEIDGIICSGKTRNNKQTYALLSEIVPKRKTLTREESISKLARTYFTSHCPATLQDFVWWSGLSQTQAKQALETIKVDFVSETIDNQVYWFPRADARYIPVKNQVFLLPAYDEYIISYRDRTASLPFEIHNKAVSNNGIFRPIIVINGQVSGLWKRTIKKDTVILETELFQTVSTTIKNLIEEAAIPYGEFLNKKIEIVHRSI